MARAKARPSEERESHLWDSTGSPDEEVSPSNSQESAVQFGGFLHRKAVRRVRRCKNGKCQMQLGAERSMPISVVRFRASMSLIHLLVHLFFLAGVFLCLVGVRCGPRLLN